MYVCALLCHVVKFLLQLVGCSSIHNSRGSNSSSNCSSSSNGRSGGGGGAGGGGGSSSISSRRSNSSSSNSNRRQLWEVRVSRPPDYGMGVVDLHEISLYPTMYRNMNENNFQSGHFSKIKRFVYIK